mgnify:CR=1 FL=1
MDFDPHSGHSLKVDFLNPTNASGIEIFEMLYHLPTNIIITNIHNDYCNESDNYQEINIVNYAYTYQICSYMVTVKNCLVH